MNYEIPKRLTDELAEREAYIAEIERSLTTVTTAQQTMLANALLVDSRVKLNATKDRIERFRDMVEAAEIVFDVMMNKTVATGGGE